MQSFWKRQFGVKDNNILEIAQDSHWRSFHSGENGVIQHNPTEVVILKIKVSFKNSALITLKDP